MDFFQILDLPRSLRLDEVMLRERYFDKSREHHPDFHGNAGIEQTSLINQAYRTLSDPFERARYLITLELPDLSDADKKNIPPSLLMEVMEMQEIVASLHDETEDDKRKGLTDQLKQIQSGLDEKMNTLRSELDSLSTQWDSISTDDTQVKNDILTKLNTLLNTRNYLRTLLRSIANELGSSS